MDRYAKALPQSDTVEVVWKSKGSVLSIFIQVWVLIPVKHLTSDILNCPRVSKWHPSDPEGLLTQLLLSEKNASIRKFTLSGKQYKASIRLVGHHTRLSQTTLNNRTIRIKCSVKMSPTLRREVTENCWLKCDLYVTSEGKPTFRLINWSGT